MIGGRENEENGRTFDSEAKENQSSNGSSVSSPVTSKKTPAGAKTVKTMKKEKIPEAVTQSKAKPVLRSSTIERLAVARTAPKGNATKTSH